MDGERPIGRTEAEKARLVWEATLPKAEQLDDETAALLGNKLGWIATWFATDCAVKSQKRKTDEAAHLEEILRQTRALAELLRRNDSALNRLERFYPNPFQRDGPPTLFEMATGHAAIEKAATEALAERRKVNPIISRKGISSLDRYIFALVKVYEEYTHRPVGASATGSERKGPFVRFVEEASRQFGAQRPSVGTIAAALRKRSNAGASWHVIAMVKKQSQ